MCSRCGYEPRDYFGVDAATAREVEGKRIEDARKIWQKRNGLANYDPNYRLDLKRDAFETVAEWKARLEAKPVLTGKATLLKEGYNIETGYFPVKLAMKNGFAGQSTNRFGLKLNRDEARDLYQGGSERDVYARLKVTGVDWQIVQLELPAEQRVYVLNKTAIKTGDVFCDSFLDGQGQGAEMVVLSGGTFAFGESNGARKVKVEAFAVGKYPVTFEEWDACVADRGTSYKPSENDWGRGMRPVINVSWNDVQEYLVWLSQKTGQDYRLLSDIEWEYACRAGTGTVYSFGDDESQLAQYAWYHGNSGRKTHPVGEKKPNPWGLYDMHGNVWEWVADAHESGGRVLRGGSWGDNPEDLRAATRGRSGAAVRGLIIGFRLARTLP
jgi:formylglycine-generating enzyme required for sulfatase activity